MDEVQALIRKCGPDRVREELSKLDRASGPDAPGDAGGQQGDGAQSKSNKPPRTYADIKADLDGAGGIQRRIESGYDQVKGDSVAKTEHDKHVATVRDARADTAKLEKELEARPEHIPTYPASCKCCTIHVPGRRDLEPAYKTVKEEIRNRNGTVETDADGNKKTKDVQKFDLAGTVRQQRDEYGYMILGDDMYTRGIGRAVEEPHRGTAALGWWNAHIGGSYPLDALDHVRKTRVKTALLEEVPRAEFGNCGGEYNQRYTDTIHTLNGSYSLNKGTFTPRHDPTHKTTHCWRVAIRTLPSLEEVQQLYDAVADAAKSDEPEVVLTAAVGNMNPNTMPTETIMGMVRLFGSHDPGDIIRLLELSANAAAGPAMPIINAGLIMLGAPGSGKSMWHDLINHIHGPTNTLGATLNDATDPDKNTRFVFERISHCTIWSGRESGKSDRPERDDRIVAKPARTDAVKAILSGEAKSFDRRYVGDVNMEYVHLGFVHSMQYPLHVHRDDDGWHRKTQVIEFHKSFSPDVGRVLPKYTIDVAADNPEQLAIYMNEADKTAGLWLRILTRLKQDGLTYRKTANENRAAYSDTPAALDSFLRYVKYETGPEHRTRSSPLYDAYKAWCTDMGEAAMSRKRFSSEMKERGFGRVQKEGPHYYTGISVAEANMPE